MATKRNRAVVMQRKTRRPVQFEITEMSRDAVQSWTRAAGPRNSDFVFPSRTGSSPHHEAIRPDRPPMGARNRLG
jgi:hypothetical protein